MAYGNDNIASYDQHQYLTYDGTSDSTTLDGKAKAITLYATTACWVKVGRGAQTAVKDSAEKTKGGTFYVPATTFISGIRVSGSDEAPVYVAAVQDASGGNLHIYEHFDF